MAVNLSPVGGVAAQFFTNTGAVLTGGKLYTYAAGTTTPAATFTSGTGVTAWTNPIVLDAAGRVSGSGEIWLTDGVQYKFVLKDANDVLIATYDNISGINSNFVNFVAEQEIQTATAGQTVFTLTTTQYQPGTNTLSVYVDGVNQYGPGTQYSYVETSSTVITFNAGLHVGAEVKFSTAQTLSGGAIDSSQVTYDPPFTGSVPTNVENKLAQMVSVIDFGADPTGVADSAPAIRLAMQASFNINFESGIYYIASPIDIATESGANASSQWYGQGATIKGDGDLITGVQYSYFEGINFENITTRGKLITGVSGRMGTFVQCNFGKAAYHIYSPGVNVFCRFDECFFRDANQYSRLLGTAGTSGTNSYEENHCYTWYCNRGLYLAGPGGDCNINSSVFEINNYQAIEIDVGVGSAQYGININSCYFEANGQLSAVEDVYIVPGSGFSCAFRDCVFVTRVVNPVSNNVFVNQTAGTSNSCMIQIENSPQLTIYSDPVVKLGQSIVYLNSFEQPAQLSNTTIYNRQTYYPSANPTNRAAGYDWTGLLTLAPSRSVMISVTTGTVASGAGTNYVNQLFYVSRDCSASGKYFTNTIMNDSANIACEVVLEAANAGYRVKATAGSAVSFWPVIKINEVN